MSHVDEGLIHAWLDGQLSPGEAARVEQLVATDAAWGAAAAEARGMIAGASRILGALDDVPAVRSTRERDSAGARARRSARSSRNAWWLRAAASIVLVAGVAGVAGVVWWRMPEDQSMRTSVPSTDAVAPPVMVERPAVLQQRTPAPRVPQLPEKSERQRAPSPAVVPAERAENRDAISAKPVAPLPVAPLSVVEQGVMGGARPASAGEARSLDLAAKTVSSQLEIDPRLGGCWVPLEPAVRADARATGAAELRDRDVFVLRFIAPVVTDVVRATVPPAAARGVPPSARMAPAGARVQNAPSRKLNDSTFVSEWLRYNGTTQVTFTVLGDTLRGTAVFGGRGAQLASQPFTAVRTTCPP